MGRSGKKREGRQRAELLLRHEVFLLVQKGRSGLRRRRLHEAEDSFRKVLDLDPTHRAALAGLGETYLMQKEHIKAGEVLEQAIAFGPPSPHLLYNAANAFRGAQRREKAFKYYLQLIEVNPSHVRGLTRLGEAYLERKDFGRAQEVLEQALDLEPYNLYALRGVARAHRGKRDYRAAIVVYERLLKLMPGDHRILVRLGEAYAHEGDAASARRAYQLALQIDPENHYARDGLAQLA